MARKVVTDADLRRSDRCYECGHRFANGDVVIFVPANEANKPAIGQDMANLRGLWFCEDDKALGGLTGIAWGTGSYGGHHVTAEGGDLFDDR